MEFEHIKNFLNRHKEMARTPGMDMKITFKDAIGLSTEMAFLLAHYRPVTETNSEEVLVIKIDGKK